MVDVVGEGLQGPNEMRGLLGPQGDSAKAAAPPDDARHAINLRLSIPLWPKKYYFVVLAGEEQRNAQRVKEERKSRPVATRWNLLFVSAVSVIGILTGGTAVSWLLIWLLSL